MSSALNKSHDGKLNKTESRKVSRALGSKTIVPKPFESDYDPEVVDLEESGDEEESSNSVKHVNKQNVPARGVEADILKKVNSDNENSKLNSGTAELWRKKYEVTLQTLRQKENTIKQLDLKIPDMLKEFQRCISNKDTLIQLNETKVSEITEALKSKEQELAESISDNDKLRKEYKELIAKNIGLEEQLSRKEVEMNRFAQEVSEKYQCLEKELQDKMLECNNLNQNVNVTNNYEVQLAEKIKYCKKLEELNMRLKNEGNANLEKKVKETRTNCEKEYKLQMSKVKESLYKSYQAEITNYKSKMSLLESDLKKNCDLVVSTEVENKKANEKINSLEDDLKKAFDLANRAEEKIQLLENSKGDTTSCLEEREAELKSARESLSNVTQIQENIKTLMMKTEKQSLIIQNQSTVIKKLKTQNDEAAKKLTLASKMQKQYLKLKEEKSQFDVASKKNNEEIGALKSRQEQLLNHVNQLEYNNFFNKEVVKQLKLELKTVKEQKNATIKRVSLVQASQEYSKILQITKRNSSLDTDIQLSRKRICPELFQVDQRKRRKTDVIINDIEKTLVETRRLQGRLDDILHRNENVDSYIAVNTIISEVISDAISEHSSKNQDLCQGLLMNIVDDLRNSKRGSGSGF